MGRLACRLFMGMGSLCKHSAQGWDGLVSRWQLLLRGWCGVRFNETNRLAVHMGTARGSGGCRTALVEH